MWLAGDTLIIVLINNGNAVCDLSGEWKISSNNSSRLQLGHIESCMIYTPRKDNSGD